MYSAYLFLGLIASTACAVSDRSTVVFLIHGISSSPDKLEEFKQSLVEHDLNVSVPLITYDTLIDMNVQLIYLANQMYEYLYDNDDVNNIVLVGISQGGLLARAFVECYVTPDSAYSWQLITIGTPHGGIYYTESDDDDYITIYSDDMPMESDDMPTYTLSDDMPMESDDMPTDTLSVFNYYRDPLNYLVYVFNSGFLSIYNNELITYESDLYTSALATLENFVMVWSPNDSVISPPESAKFWTYEPYSLNLTDERFFYDLHLENVNITVYETKCDHVDYITSCLKEIENIVLQYV